MRVRFLDLAAEHAPIAGALRSAMNDVLASGVFVGGEAVLGLEQDLARFLAVAHVVTVNSGTDALRLSLEACGIGPGDEVIVPSYTFIATAAAVKAVGARPVFVDCRADSFLLDVDALEQAVSGATRALIPVHLFGEVAPMGEIQAVATRHGLTVIEDAAQAFSAQQDGRHAGTLGDVGAFSFYPSKILGALGDGGAIATHDEALAVRLRRLQNHGRSSHFLHVEGGHNSRLDAMQAAALRVKLGRVDAGLTCRRALARIYDESLCGLPVGRPSMTQAVFANYVIRTPERDALQRWLAYRGVDSAVYYATPCHLQPAFQADLRAGARCLPIAEGLAKTALALPLYPSLSPEAARYVGELIQDFHLRGYRAP